MCVYVFIVAHVEGLVMKTKIKVYFSLRMWDRPNGAETHETAQVSMSVSSVSISHSDINSASVLTISLRFVFGAVKRDWLLILALQTTFNVYYFFYVVLGAISYKLITIYSCNDDYHRQNSKTQ
jgi:hypothetical protein